jgi:hypothetical protein
MDSVSAIVLLTAAAVPVALVASWFVKSGGDALGSAVHRGDADAWWRTSMPWPHGVQEEDGLPWHLDPDRDGDASSEPSISDGSLANGYEVAPLRANPHLAVRDGPRAGSE